MAVILIQQVIDALRDESKVFPAHYLHRLSDLTPVDAGEIKKIWSSISPRRRTALLEDLEQLGEADDILCFEDVCRIALKDDLPVVRSLAVQILSTYELPDLIPGFLTMMEKDRNSEVRATAAEALGSYIYMGELDKLSSRVFHRIVDSLIRVATGSDEKLVRRRALEALGYSSREEIPPLIDKAYAMKDIDWQISALIAMGRSADDRWGPQVLEHLDDIRPVVRAEAATAAGEIELEAATRPLLKLLRDDDDDVRTAAIWSISQIGGERIAEALEALLDHTKDEDEAELIQDALDNLAFTEGVRKFDLLDIPKDEADDEDDFDDEDDVDEDQFSEDDWEDEGGLA